MIGVVIEGRYVGASVNKLPDRNVLFIQTEDGTKVSISKNNTISVDDVTKQYPSQAKKTIIVLWNDFETSIIQLGIAEQAKPTPTTHTEKVSPSSDFRSERGNYTHTKEKACKASTKAKPKQNWLPIIIATSVPTVVVLLVFSICLLTGVLQFTSSKNVAVEQTNTQQQTLTQIPAIQSKPTAQTPDKEPVIPEDISYPEAVNELVIGEWIILKVNGTEMKFRFDGFTPIQDKGDFGKVIMLLCAIENTSNSDYDTYYFFRDNIKITDADGFSIPLSSNGWNYDGYDCSTDIDRREKKRIVQSYECAGYISDFTMIICDDENVYVYEVNE